MYKFSTILCIIILSMMLMHIIYFNCFSLSQYDIKVFIVKGNLEACYQQLYRNGSGNVNFRGMVIDILKEGTLI